MSGTATLVLTGDSMITRGIAMNENDDARALAAHIGNGDAALTNLEVLPNDFKGYPAQECGGTHMAASSSVVDTLTGLGFNLFPAATNHALDYSIEGLLATIDVLNEKGVVWAGLGRNMAEARMPAYLDTDRASFALISVCSSFAKGQQASEQRPDMPGRPGLNPLRVSTTYDISAEHLEALREIAEAIGIEQRRREIIALGFGHPPAD
ncbi:MAG: CapA family protein, partial [Thermomicrobiales bacterium]|nr:CapA family protein [Thermomicrobiales bacterium]